MTRFVFFYYQSQTVDSNMQLFIPLELYFLIRQIQDASIFCATRRQKFPFLYIYVCMYDVCMFVCEDQESLFTSKAHLPKISQQQLLMDRSNLDKENR